MAGSNIRDAAARIFDLLGEEERRKRRLTTMMDRLQQDGWVDPQPARPVAGPTVADAASAIEARLTTDDALRAEAGRQLATADATNENSPLDFQRAAPESNGTVNLPETTEDAEPADGVNSLVFKKDNSIPEWRWAVPPMARYLGIDEDMAVQADSDIVPILAGIHAYRHLAPRSRESVMGLIDKMAKNPARPDLWPLAGRLQEHVISAVASPYQSLWSMSDDEIREHIQRQQDFLDIIDVAGDAQDAGELGLIGLGAAKVASKLTVPGAVASGLLLASKYATKANKAHLEEILQNRRNGGNPFDRPLPPVE